MKRTASAVLMIALAIMALAAPAAFAQAPAPKVTINGLIDNVMSYSQNMANYNTGVFNRGDQMWYMRTRGRFDFIGEVGKAKGVLGIELDHVYGQTGSSESNFTNGGGATGAAVTPGVGSGFGTDGSFGLNSDVRGIIEIKWLYVEFPVPLIPVPTTMRLGAQPFGAAANYKLAMYANGDFAGINIVSQLTPNFKMVWTYVQVEENLTGPQTNKNFAGVTTCNAAGNNPNNCQNRGDDFSVIAAPEITVFKGLDIKPMLSGFYAQGTTSGSARQGRGGINTSTNFTSGIGSSIGGMNERRYTVGADGRLRMGAFSLDPTILFQFGNRGVNVQPGACVGGTELQCSGAPTDGKKYYAKLSALFVDLRAGYQLGPLLIEGLGVYTTGNSARNNTLHDVHYFQPLDTDTSYLGDWGTQLTSLGLDYLNAFNEAGGRMAYPGAAIGWDKYGRGQVGLKATYAITPALSVMGTANGHWTAQAVDRNAAAVAGAGLATNFMGCNGNPAATGASCGRDKSSYVGTEFAALVSWRFADGLAWDNSFGYMIMGHALDAVTDPNVGPRNTNDPWMLTSRVRFTF